VPEEPNPAGKLFGWSKHMEPDDKLFNWGKKHMGPPPSQTPGYGSSSLQSTFDNMKMMNPLMMNKMQSSNENSKLMNPGLMK